MMKLNLQMFAHKKGMGSTRNGRDSESQRPRQRVQAPGTEARRRSDGSGRQHSRAAARHPHPSRP